MVSASSRAGTTISTSGNSGGAAGASCGADRQNRPCAKNKYSQISSDGTTITAAYAARGSNRLIQRFREGCEEPGTRRGHGPAVLQANAKFTGNIDSRLVGEAHAGLQRRRITVHQVGGLVAVQPDAVPRAVRKSRQFVAGSPTFPLIVAAHRIVDRSRRHADLRRLERDFLAALHGVPHLALACARLADHPGSRYVGLIAVHRAAAVHQDDRALAHGLGLYRPMRIG